MRYAISYGNGNDGLSRLHAAFTVEAPEGSQYLIARLAMLSDFHGSKAYRYVRQALEVNDACENAAEAVVYDPPGRDSVGYSDVNGAWRVACAYDAEEITNDPNHYDSLEAAFGWRLVAANRKHG